MRLVKLSDEQRGFIPWLLDNMRSSRVMKLTGHAGSGKTTVMRELDKCWPMERSFWCCPSHHAKNILSGKLYESEACTVASALGLGRVVIDGVDRFVPIRKNKIDEKFRLAVGNHRNILIVDESSMVDDDLLRQILETAADNILFVGDPAQIPPVSSGIAPIYADTCQYPTYHLSQIFRQDNGSNILQVANDTRESGMDTTEQHGIKNIALTEENVCWFFDTYPNGIALCPTHKIKEFCNTVVRKHVNGGVSPSQIYMEDEKLFLESPVCIGGPVNGDMVTICSRPQEAVYAGFRIWTFRIIASDGEKYWINTPYDESERKHILRRIADLGREYRQEPSLSRKQEINSEVETLVTQIVFVSHGFAMTIHKSQGSTFESVLLCVSGLDAFRKQGIHINMVYTGITRASKNLVIGR